LDADVIEHEIEREIKDDARFGTIDVEENEEVKEAEEWYMEYLNNQWLVIGIIAVILICCLISIIWFFYGLMHFIYFYQTVVYFVYFHSKINKKRK